MIKSINISKELWEKHSKGNFSQRVVDALEFYEKAKELKKQYPNDQMLGAVVRNVL
jgi:predicted thioesterase